MKEIELTGNEITLEQIKNVARQGAKVTLSSRAKDNIRRSREVVDRLVEQSKVVYGVTTGFGMFSETFIQKEFTNALQKNLIISHAVGAGEYFSDEVVRTAMLLRINNFIYGYSGIRLETVETLVEMLNRGVTPLVPEKGSLGASGDLVPLAHMVLPLLGGVPATAAIARTSVAVKSGQQTRLTSVFHAVFLLASMFLLGGVMARLPLAALAGVLMVTTWRMNDWEGIRYLLSHRFKSGISQFFITMIATVAADLTVAILVGIVYSALLYIVKASHINVSFSDIDASRLPGAPCGEMPRAGVAYVTGSLFFGAVDEFGRLMAEMPDYREVIFSLRGMPSLDVSGAQALLELCTHLKEQGRGVAFCGVAPEVRLYFDRAGITALVGEDAFFWSADQAIFALLEKESAAG